MNNSTRKCKKDYCEKVFLKGYMKAYKKSQLKGALTKKDKKHIIKKCRLEYCNPTCKGTIFQNGKEFPKNIFSASNNKSYKNVIKKERKRIFSSIFGKKTSVLQNGFYENLTAKTVKNLKQKGAISACINYHYF